MTERTTRTTKLCHFISKALWNKWKKKTNVEQLIQLHLENERDLHRRSCVKKLCHFISKALQVDSAFYPPWDGKMSTSQRAVMFCSWGVKAGMV